MCGNVHPISTSISMNQVFMLHISGNVPGISVGPATLSITFCVSDTLVIFGFQSILYVIEYVS